MFFNHLIGNLLRGKFLRYQAFQGSRFYYLGIRVANMASYAISSSMILMIHDNMINGTNHIV
jgi:hypothetical protein